MAACLISKLLGKKVVTETSLIGADDPATLSKVTTWKGPLKPKYLKYLIYKKSNAYVSKSEYMTDKLKLANIYNSRITEIPYSVDTNLFRPIKDSEKNLIRLNHNIPKDAVLVLFVGGVE